MIKNILITLVLLISSISYAEVKIGALFAVTGPASFLGLPEKQTLEMLVDELNANGGINGEKIELTVYDTKGSDQEARKKFLRLVKKDRVVAVIGPTRSGSTLAIKDLADNEKVPVLSCAASSRIVEPLSKYMFKVAPSDSHAVEKIFEFLSEKGKSKIAVLTAQNGFGDSGREALEQLAPQYKIEIVANEKFRDTDKDMTSQLSKIASNNPDAVIVWGVGPAPAIVAKNFRQLNMKGMLIMSHSPVSTFGGHAFDSFLMFKKGYEAAGKDKTKIVAEVEKIKGMIGTAGEFNLSETDHNGLTKEAFEMLVIKNGNWEIAE
jgi:branched-chain amino acid transport system substrate-binding protein